MVPESTCNIRKGFVLEGSIRVRLIEFATSSSKIIGTVFDTKHITYIIVIILLYLNTYTIRSCPQTHTLEQNELPS